MKTNTKTISSLKRRVKVCAGQKKIKVQIGYKGHFLTSKNSRMKRQHGRKLASTHEYTILKKLLRIGRR